MLKISREVAERHVIQITWPARQGRSHGSGRPQKDFEAFPGDARSIFLTALTIAAEGGTADIANRRTSMKSERLELVHGGGNVFRDLGREEGDVEQLRALLAAEIIKALDRDELTVRAAHARTGFAAADFSRIRNADLARFTSDRLMSILNGWLAGGSENTGPASGRRTSRGEGLSPKRVGTLLLRIQSSMKRHFEISPVAPPPLGS